jgi:hypothetical protein
MFKKLRSCICFTGTQTKEEDPSPSPQRMTGTQSKEHQQLTPEELMVILYFFAYVAMVYQCHKVALV